MFIPRSPGEFFLYYTRPRLLTVCRFDEKRGKKNHCHTFEKYQNSSLNADHGMCAII